MKDFIKICRDCRREFLAYKPFAKRCPKCRYEKIKKTATLWRNKKYRTDKDFRERVKAKVREYYKKHHASPILPTKS
ncbi:MAG: hypothetical protein WC437_04780 [Patescibacteria group bacterium]